MRKSVWTESIQLPRFKKINGTIKTDVLVIGGGICGLLCAKYLTDAGINCVLVEANTIASGITKNTTAKITTQHGLVYHKLIKQFGKEKAQMYYNPNNQALLEYKNLCKKINSDLEIKPAYTYSVNSREILEKEASALEQLGIEYSFEEQTELPFETKGAILFPEQAQFNPLKFICEIVKDLIIYENTFIKDISPYKATSDTGEIEAKKIIVTTHFPFINKHGSYFLKLYQHRSYVSAYKNAKLLNGMYVDEDSKGLSFRNYEDLLLIGGGSHRTGKSGGNWKELHAFAKKYFPYSEIKYEWATQDCMSLDSVPYIGKYSAKTPNLFVATGFNKWGMTSAMVAAQILCDMVLGKENENAPVFSPQRSILKPRLVVNGIEATINLLTPTAKRCPHLGCALKWNKAEHTWDCPCHGSRFDQDGKLIDNPATGDANIK